MVPRPGFLFCARRAPPQFLDNGKQFPMSNSKYLMLDTSLWAQDDHLKVTPGLVRKATENPLFGEELPWEVRYDNLYANVIFDWEDGLYKCWYNPFIIDLPTTDYPPEQREGGTYRAALDKAKAERQIKEWRDMGVCYAVSSDGIQWTKPDLGLIEFQGSAQNNLVMRNALGAGVTLDRHDRDRSGRFKAFLKGGVASSPDGLHWSDLQACPEIKAKWDTHNNLFWDERHGKYVGMTRLWDGGFPDGERIVGRTESQDFNTWTQAVEVLRALPEEPERQTYTLIAFPYANLYLGLLMMFNTETDLVDCELAWSRDTVEWERVCPGTPLIPRGPEGSIDWGCVYGAAYPFLKDGRLQLYYGGSNGRHTDWRAGFLGLATLRPDGFAGVTPANKPQAATLVTQPVNCTGRQLCLSADADGGAVRAAVADVDAMSLAECTPIQTDGTDAPVHWRDGQDLTALVGQEVQLIFELREATLYSFSFTD